MTIDLPVFRFATDPALAEELQRAAQHVIESRRYVLGPEVDAFEQEFAHDCGVLDCVSVANGTDALELGLRAMGVARGDRVVVAANAGFYASTALLAIGAVPSYVEIGDDLVVTPASLQTALAGARAIVVTHLYGKLAPIEAIVAIADAAGVAVLEDCAQAHGAHRDGRMAGSFGAAGCFSFYPTKNLGALGDGGAIVTSDAGIGARARSLRQYGWGVKYHVVESGGRNSRLDELQAAFLRVKLPRLAAGNAARVAVAARYCEALAGLPLRLPRWTGGDYVAHLFVVRSRDREALRTHLGRAGIGTDVHYPVPDHLQPAGAAHPRVRLPATEAACNEVLTLPCYPDLRDAEIDRVVDALRTFFDARRAA